MQGSFSGPCTWAAFLWTRRRIIWHLHFCLSGAQFLSGVAGNLLGVQWILWGRLPLQRSDEDDDDDDDWFMLLIHLCYTIQIYSKLHSWRTAFNLTNCWYLLRAFLNWTKAVFPQFAFFPFFFFPISFFFEKADFPFLEKDMVYRTLVHGSSQHHPSLGS